MATEAIKMAPFTTVGQPRPFSPQRYQVLGRLPVYEAAHFIGRPVLDVRVEPGAVVPPLQPAFLHASLFRLVPP